MNKIRNIKSAVQKNSRPKISITPGNLKKNVELIKDSVSAIFCVFKSINNTYQLIYKNNLFYIISYDLINSQKLSQIKFNNFDFDEIKHFLDKINKRDLILFINFDTIKIFNVSDWTCVFQIKENINKINNRILGVCYRIKSLDRDGGINACIFENCKKNYIVTSYLNSQHFKFWDLNGNKIKDIKTPNEKNYIIETYQNLIISGNVNCCTSYNFHSKQFKNYKVIKNGKINYYFNNLTVYKTKQGILKLIAKAQQTNIDKYSIFIWNFNSCEIINKIDFTIIKFDSGFNLWNENYLIFGVGDKFRILNLYKEQFTQDIQINDGIYYYKIIMHPKFGKCIMYTDYSKKIKLLHK